MPRKKKVSNAAALEEVEITRARASTYQPVDLRARTSLWWRTEDTER